ncbi:MAG: hypothetical protein C0605_07995 [Hyphomicrobiales bacterium]|nr:MAG: hypothetical protein C0605_07995 [Hyphomicrobiales bacterium]
MSDGVVMKIRRKDKLRQKLLALAPAAEKEIKSAVEKSATELESSAKHFAPVDSGAMKAGIKTRIERGGMAARVGVFDPKLFYVRFVEFGTRTAPAQPFLFPSYRLLRRRIRGRFSRAINKAAKEVAGK